jgi:hypothetical protein
MKRPTVMKLFAFLTLLCATASVSFDRLEANEHQRWVDWNWL